MTPGQNIIRVKILSDTGPCGAGACVYLPLETNPIYLKQPVTKHGSILLGEMVAIKMVLDFILEKTHQKVKITRLLERPKYTQWPKYAEIRRKTHKFCISLLIILFELIYL